MKKWLRRLRGALGIGLTWAAGWVVVGPLACIALVAAMFGLDRASAEILLSTAGFFAISGFVGGATFSLLLSLAEGRRTFDELSLPRFGGWGAIAGALTYGGALAIFGDGWGPFAVGLIAIAGLLGTGSATGSLALARRSDAGRLGSGEAGDREELPADEGKQALPGRPR